MKISEYIASLAAIAAEHGDLDCAQVATNGNVTKSVGGPRIAHLATKRPREILQRFWTPRLCRDDERGEKVCKI